MKIEDKSYKLEMWITALLWVVYFIFIENGAESKILYKLLGVLVALTAFFFSVYANRKRKQANSSYENDLIFCLIGWTLYLLIYSINPNFKFLSYVFVGLAIFSAYVALIYLGKLMLKIGGDDLY